MPPEVSIISAPFKKADSKCAQIKAGAEADGQTFCFNPDTDFHLFNVTADAGSQGWMNCWIRIAHISKMMGGTAYFIVDEQTNTFPGGQQDGEHAAAELAGCNIKYEYGSISSVPPSKAASSAASPARGGGGGGMLDKVEQIKSALGITAATPKDALAEANEQVGLPTQGPLLAQVDALMKALGLTDAVNLS